MIAAAAPSAPFYYYDFSALTGVSFSIEKFLIEAPSKILTSAGIKFTSHDLISYRRSLEVTDRFDLPWDVDEMLARAKGGVGATYN